MTTKRLPLLVRLLLIICVLGILPLVGIWLYIAQPTLTSNDPSTIEVSPDVLEGHVRKLAEEYHPRSSLYHANMERCAEYIAEIFRQTGGEVRFQEIPNMNPAPRNVICTFDQGHEDWLIVGAHYDSFGNTPGADDNASAVAILLEVSKLIGAADDIGMNLEFVAYTLEEPPYFGTRDMGSYVHAEALHQSGRRVKGMICLEMMGFFSDEPHSQSYPIPALNLMYPDTGDFLAVIGKLDQQTFTREVKKGMKGVTPLEIHSINAPTVVQGIDFSDHRNYWTFDMNAVMITNTAFYRNHHYHRTTDTPDRLDYDRMAQATVAVFEMLKAL